MHLRPLIPLLALPALVCSAHPAEAAPVALVSKVVGGVHVQLVRVDLSDKATELDIQLAHNAPQANSPDYTYGDEPFGAMVSRAHAAAVINGTFFSKDAQKRVMGNMVKGGTFVKYSQWENAGTTFGLRSDNLPEMITARAEGKPDWTSHWFSITCGPRLLKDGSPWLHPLEEGFTDSHVMGVAARSALGYTRDGHTLYLVSFRTPVSLAREAQVMRALGCYQAMNLDGGASQGLAVGGHMLLSPGRSLTNAIAVYDARHPAPEPLEQAHERFRTNHLAAFFSAVKSKFQSLNYGQAETEEPEAPLLRRLKPGEKLSFASLSFQHVAKDPVVGVQDGQLNFAEDSFGQIFARWPRPRTSYTLSFQARVVDEYLSVFFDASRRGAQLVGTSLEYRQASPAGLYLRHNGQLVSYQKDVAIDRGWHRYRLRVEPDRVKVYLDGSFWPVLEAERGSIGDGVGFAGRGQYRDFSVTD